MSAMQIFNLACKALYACFTLIVRAKLLLISMGIPHAE